MCVRGYFVLGSARVKALDDLKKEERKKKKTKMTKPEFHRFLVRHVSNIFELSLAIARNGATPESRFIMCLAYKIYNQVKYQRLNANTCIVAAILFSAHPYIDRTTVRSNTR